MTNQVSKGFHEIENSNIAKKYTTSFSVLKSLKKSLKTNNTAQNKTVSSGNLSAPQPSEKLLPSQQKRLIRTFTMLESGQKLANTELNRKDVRRLGRFGFLKSYYKDRPSAAIDTANRVSERAVQAMPHQPAHDPEEEHRKARVRQVERRLQEERPQNTAVSAMHKQYTRATSVGSAIRSDASHNTIESRESAASSISAVLAQNKPSVEVEKNEPATLPPEPVDDGQIEQN